MRIRPARAAEATTIGELSVLAYTQGGHLQADDSYASTLRNVASRLAQTFVAVDDDDRVIGAVTVCHFGDDHAELAVDLAALQARTRQALEAQMTRHLQAVSACLLVS